MRTATDQKRRGVFFPFVTVKSDSKGDNQDGEGDIVKTPGKTKGKKGVDTTVLIQRQKGTNKGKIFHPAGIQVL